MAQKLLFEDVCEFNQGGVKQLYVSTILDKQPNYYPLEYYFSGDTLYFIDENITFIKLNVSDNTVVTQSREINLQGKWFSKELKFTISKIDLDSLQFLNSWLFKKNIVSSGSTARPTNLDNYNTTIIFQDMNDMWWISGYDVPFKITAFEMLTGAQAQENAFNITMQSRSYDRIRKIDPNINPCGIIFNQETTTTTTVEPQCGFSGGTAIEYSVVPPTTTTTTLEPTTTTTTTTTTTSTTTAAPANNYEGLRYTCQTCIEVGVAVVNDDYLLTIGMYYYLTNGDVILVTGMTSNTPTHTIATSTSFATCPSSCL